jgi:hypothetical protein
MIKNHHGEDGVNKTSVRHGVMTEMLSNRAKGKYHGYISYYNCIVKHVCVGGVCDIFVSLF